MEKNPDSKAVAKKATTTANKPTAEKKPAVKKAKTDLIELSVLKVEQIKEVEGLKKKQEDVVKANPFVKIVDAESYELAKKHRTALLTASTSTEKESKNGSSFINNFKKLFQDTLAEWAGITRTKYDEQQAEVKRHEDVLEDERRKKKEEQDRKDQEVKDFITSLKQSIVDQIAGMKFDTVDAVDEFIQQLKSERSGTFDKFNILFDVMIEDQITAYKTARNSVEDAHLRQEEERKAKHTNLIANISAGSKELIFNATIKTLDAVEQKLVEVIHENKHDFQEYKPQFDDLKKEIISLFETAKTRIEQEAKKAKEDEEKEKELEALRAKSRYSDRCDVLLSIGMTKNVRGDMVFADSNYKKELITSDSDIEFQKNVDFYTLQINPPAVEKTPEEEPINATPAEHHEESNGTEEAPEPKYSGKSGGGSGAPKIGQAEQRASELQNLGMTMNWQAKSYEGRGSVVLFTQIQELEKDAWENLLIEIKGNIFAIANVEVPTVLQNPDLTALVNLMQGYLHELKKPEEERDIKDIQHHVYEQALITFFGKDVFEFINLLDQ